MAKTGKFIHRAEWEGTQAIGTAYLASGAGQELIVNQSSGYGEGLVGRLSHLLLNFSGAGANTKMTAFLTKDAAGDEVIVPETEMTITYGRATAGTGGCAARLNVDIRLLPTELHNGTSLFIWVKTDAAAATLTDARLFWEE